MNTLTHALPIVNPIFLDAAQVIDDYRPTAGPDFLPSLEDELQYLDLLATHEEREAIMAELAEADRLGAIEVAFRNP
jgi:hypothetical protein